MREYRTGNHWKQQTVILCGTGPADEQGRRPDDRPVVFVDSSAPEGLAERICGLLNFDDLLAASSLGTPEAVAARESVPDEVALRIIERSKQLARECDCGAEGIPPIEHYPSRQGRDSDGPARCLACGDSWPCPAVEVRS